MASLRSVSTPPNEAWYTLLLRYPAKDLRERSIWAILLAVERLLCLLSLWSSHVLLFISSAPICSERQNPQIEEDGRAILLLSQ